MLTAEHTYFSCSSMTCFYVLWVATCYITSISLLQYVNITKLLDSSILINFQILFKCVCFVDFEDCYPHCNPMT